MINTTRAIIINVENIYLMYTLSHWLWMFVSIWFFVYFMSVWLIFHLYIWKYCIHNNQETFWGRLSQERLDHDRRSTDVLERATHARFVDALVLMLTGFFQFPQNLSSTTSCQATARRNKCPCDVTRVSGGGASRWGSRWRGQTLPHHASLAPPPRFCSFALPPLSTFSFSRSPFSFLVKAWISTFLAGNPQHCPR